MCNKIHYNTQNRLLRSPARKWNSAILKEVNKYGRKLRGKGKQMIYLAPESMNESGCITAMEPEQGAAC